MKLPHFYEKQRFTQWWIWLILILLNILFAIAAYEQFTEQIFFGAKPMSDTGLLLTWLLTIAITLLFLVMKLETQIADDTVLVRFFPFHTSYRQFESSTMAKAYIRRYSAVYEYGGWGLRLGWFGKGTAYTIKGSDGLQLEFKNGKKLLIGTQNPEELKHTLKNLIIDI